MSVCIDKRLIIKNRKYSKEKRKKRNEYRFKRLWI